MKAQIEELQRKQQGMGTILSQKAFKFYFVFSKMVVSNLPPAFFSVPILATLEPKKGSRESNIEN